ncbi:tetratricopeptide repeat protein [Streptomyces adonidis]|uniref:tetratricopeptide repeat protein n=1 Tax=Streptomyces adonidis TaxID=3231367 RepID=UPI0034DB6720
MEAERVVAVLSPDRGQCSGYVVAPRLVLTSAHGVPGAGGAVTVRCLRADVAHAGTVLVRGTPGTEDFALVEIDADRPGRAGWPEVSFRHPVRWGRLDTTAPGTPCETWGFPDSMRTATLLDTAHPSGTVNPGDRYRSDLYVMNVGQPPPPPGHRSERSPWQGLSGAALFCGHLLTGVILGVPAYGQLARLEAVPSYVVLAHPGFQEVWHRHTGGLAQLEPVEYEPLVDRHAPALSEPPARVLVARNQAVRFRGRGREALLDELLAWAHSDDSLSVSLVHGPAGQGKTRLAVELERRLNQGPWLVNWPTTAATGDEVARLAAPARPALVVFDYAETRAAQITAFLDARVKNQRAVPVRVLLLARTAGSWWTALRSASAAGEEPLAAARVTALPPVDDTPEGHREAYAQALTDLAAALDLRRPDGEGTDWAGLAARVAHERGLDRGARGTGTPVTGTAAPVTGTGAAAAGMGTPVTDTGAAISGTGTTAAGMGTPVAGTGAAAAGTAAPVTSAGTAAAGTGAPVAGTAAAISGTGTTAAGTGAPVAGTVLTVQMTALADLYDAATSAGVADRSLDAEDRLLGHERRYLHRSATARHLLPAFSPEALTRTLTAVFLVGARSADGADRVLLRLRGVRDRTEDERDRLRHWAAAVYPPDEPGQEFGSLLPDRLAERFVGECLREEPQLPHTLLDGIDAREAAQLLTVYARSAAHTAFAGELDGHLTEFVREGPTALWGTAADVATQVEEPAPLIAALRGIAAAPHTPVAALAMLADRVPRDSQALTSLGAELMRALLDRDDPVFSRNTGIRGSSLNTLAVRLDAAGRTEEAVAVAREAVDVCRSAMAERTPDQGDTAFLPYDLHHLALALNTLSTAEGRLGDHDAALRASEEAARHCRLLAARGGAEYLPDLARALATLAVDLRAVGRSAEALEMTESAVDVYRQLPDDPDDPDRAHRSGLATALGNLAADLKDAGLPQAALEASGEALGHHRALAEGNPDSHARDLAGSLANHSLLLAHAYRHEEAAAPAVEAVALWRTLVTRHPGRHESGLAAALLQLALRHEDLGTTADALSAATEAVAIRRVQAARHPAAHNADLADALGGLARQLASHGEHDKAREAYDEVIRITRALHRERPENFRVRLAVRLNDLAALSIDTEQYADAVGPLTEAARLLGAPDGSLPGAVVPDHVNVLRNLALCHQELGDTALSVRHAEHAVRAARTLDRTSRGGFPLLLVGALRSLGEFLRRSGRAREAVTATSECLRSAEDLVAAVPSETAYAVELARATEVHALALEDLDATGAEVLPCARLNSRRHAELTLSHPAFGRPWMIALLRQGRVERRHGLPGAAALTCLGSVRHWPGLDLEDQLREALLDEFVESAAQLPHSPEATALLRDATPVLRGLVRESPPRYLRYHALVQRMLDDRQ